MEKRTIFNKTGYPRKVKFDNAYRRREGGANCVLCTDRVCARENIDGLIGPCVGYKTLRFWKP